MSLKMSYLTLYTQNNKKRPLSAIILSGLIWHLDVAHIKNDNRSLYFCAWPFLFKDHDLIDWKSKSALSTLLEDSLIVQSVQLGPKDPRIEKHSLILLYVAKSLAMFTYWQFCCVGALWQECSDLHRQTVMIM